MNVCKELINYHYVFVQIFACSTDSAEVHDAWQKTAASEESDGLGRQTPFPMLGDNTKRLCRALDVLDEGDDVARHAVVVINKEGDVVHKSVMDDEATVWREQKDIQVFRFKIITYAR